jgi:hypothetical protein
MDDLAAAAAPDIAELGSAFYFAPATLERGRQLRLDGFRFYFLGRGGVLGDVEPVVVHSAFGYFDPEMVARSWDSARQRATVGPRAVARAYLGCAHDFGRLCLAGIDVAAWCDEAGAVVDAVDPAGLALFAGYVGEPAPDDPPGRALHLLVQLRELRGSVHLLALVAAGIAPRTAHYLHRPGAYAMFGWPEGSEPEVTEDHRRRYAEAAAATDRLLAPAFAAVGDPAAFLDTLKEMVTAVRIERAGWAVEAKGD